MNKIRVDYVGWLGHGNLGDEALFLVSKKIFSPYLLTPYKRKSYSRITIFGGGTVLPHLLLDVLPSKYNYAFGVGVRDPRFWGNFHPFLVELVKRFNFRHLGVRDYRSKELLRSMGIQSEMIGDPCLLLEPHSFRKKQEAIAVNLGTSLGKVWGEDEKQIEKKITDFCIRLKKEGYRPILVPFWNDDIPCIKRVSKAAQIEIFQGWTNVQDVLDFIASCYMLIGEKLHSIVFSAASFTPFISLEYRPKCLHFADTVGFSRYTIRTDEFSLGKAMKLFHELLKNWDDMHESLIRKVKTIRFKLRDFAHLIMCDIESLPDEGLDLSSLQTIRKVSLYRTDVYLFTHFNRIWRAWYKLPIRKKTRNFLCVRSCHSQFNHGNNVEKDYWIRKK